jgi:hypothetical protein
MLRHRRLSDAKLHRDRRHHRTSGMLARGEKLQDSTADRITEDVQRVHKATLSVQTYISQNLYHPPTSQPGVSGSRWEHDSGGSTRPELGGNREL